MQLLKDTHLELTGKQDYFRFYSSLTDYSIFLIGYLAPCDILKTLRRRL